MRWYIVHTYSGFEDRVKETLRQRAEALDMGGAFGEIHIPTETIVEYRGGKKKETQRKFFPGYILVEMEMSDAAWHVVKNTPKVTGFVGSGKKPTPLTQEEVEQILQQVVSARGEAEAEVHLRQGRAGQDHRRTVQQLHRRRRRGQSGPQHPQGHGDDLRSGRLRSSWISVRYRSSSRKESARAYEQWRKKLLGRSSYRYRRARLRRRRRWVQLWVRPESTSWTSARRSTPARRVRTA